MNFASTLVSNYNTMLGTTGEETLECRLLDFLHQDSICYEAHSLPWGGTWRGVSGFVDMFAAFGHSMNLASNVAASAVSAGGGRLTPHESLVFREYSLIVPTLDDSKHEFPCIERYVVEGEKIRSIAVYFFDTSELNTLLGQ